MLLAEPGRTQYDVNFAIGGVPVRVHPFFWIVCLIFGARGNPEPINVLLWTVAVFVSILVHELGHVLAFRRFGVFAHVVLYAMGGLAVPESARTAFTSYGGGVRRPVDQIVVSLAGPFAGFALAAVIVGLLVATGHEASFHVFGFGFDISGKPLPSVELMVLVYMMLYINILWGLVNLLPVYPLDGGQVFREVLIMANPHQGARQSLILSAFTGAAIAVLGLLKFQSVFVALLFGYLAYQSYMMLQAYDGRFRGGSPW